jgi:leader peptidase (prepilin peptidase)/N-methyltransferase
VIGERALVRVEPRRQLFVTCALGVVIDGAMVWRFGWSRPLPAFLVLGAVAAVVTISDLTAWRIRSAVVIPAYPCAAVLLALACAPDGPWWPLARAGIGALLVAAFYLLLALAAPGQLALGDIRLGGLLAGALSFLGWSALATGTLAGWLLVAAAMAFRRPNSAGHRVLPFAPFLVAGALLAVLIGR